MTGAAFVDTLTKKRSVTQFSRLGVDMDDLLPGVEVKTIVEEVEATIRDFRRVLSDLVLGDDDTAPFTLMVRTRTYQEKQK